jgi:adenosylcobinamide-phosphate synthase
MKPPARAGRNRGAGGAPGSAGRGGAGGSGARGEWERGALALGLVAGALADLAFGDPRRGHPVAGFGRLAAALEARVWRPSRLAGAGYALVLVGAAGVGAAYADRRVRARPAARALLVGALTWAALGGRSLARAALDLATTVRAGDLEAARRLLPALAGRDPDGLDGPELCRAAVESVAENTADAIVGPLLWGAVAGPAGIAAYRAANTLDAMVGHRSRRYRRFGWAAARLDDVLGWPAARLGAGLACVLAPAVRGDRRLAWSTMRRDGAAHPSPNAGRLEAAFAGALGVRLGGRNRYGERVEERPALGAGPPAGPADVARAARLSSLVGVAATGLAAAGALAPRAGGVRRTPRVGGVRGTPRRCPDGSGPGGSGPGGSGRSRR